MTGAELKAVIGWNVRARREACRMNQESLADVLGCSATMVSHIESGRASPSIEMLAQLSEALNATPADLLSAPIVTVTESAGVGTFSSMDTLTVTEAAAELGLSGEMVRKHCTQGHMQAKRSSSGWLIERSEVDRFKKEKRSRGRPRKNTGAA